MIRTLLASTAFAALLVASAAAQVANISTTAASTWASYNLTSGLQNATATTYFSNDGATMLVVKGGSSAVTATVITQAQSMSQAGYGSAPLSNLVVSIPANSTVLIGPFPPARWNTPIYGTVGVSFTSVTGVSATAFSQAQ